MPPALAPAVTPPRTAVVPPSVQALLHTARAVLGMELSSLAAIEPPVLGTMPVTTAHRVAAYCGVPVRLPDGTLHGTLCGLDGEAGRAPSVGQLEALRTIAGLVGVRIAEERAAAAERAARAAHLLSAADGPDRTTVLQPIVGLRSGTVVGFEALSRFGARPPAEVFAEAHDLGVGVPPELAAARAALDLLPQLPVGTYLSINLSPRAVVDPAVLSLLTAAVGSGAGPRLVIELTEHEQVPDGDVVLEGLRDVRTRGVRLAVDDTGSGFASLQHVTRLRPDILKGRPGSPDQVLARLTPDPHGPERFVLG